MSAKRWLWCFLGTALLLGALLAGFNLLTDPFGVFGDRLFDWYSYDETNNPRVAKLAWLQEHHDEYDSYIIGCSGTSSFPTQQLNDYYGGRFYNLFMYGADMADVADMAAYMLDNYTVKNLVVNVYIKNGATYGYDSRTVTGRMHCQADGSSPAAFWAQYLFASPSYGLAKLRDWTNDTWLPQTFDVFDAATGAYDKTQRDVETIGDLPAYLRANPVFEDFSGKEQDLTETEGCMESVAQIRDMCAEKGVRLDVVCGPVYHEVLSCFPREQVEEFYRSLAQVTDYWDFSYSSVSFEPRYFYDESHFRNAQGAMALARMFGDESVYMPEDFGVYVTADTVEERLDAYWDAAPLDEETFTAQVPVLMYHHLTDTDPNDVTVTPANFEGQIAALKAAGYTAIGFDELIAYVQDAGAVLPDKPVLITFDDGYASNYEYAWPILARYGMKGTIFAIGVSMGRDTYKDTGYPIHPHFSADQAREMVASGVMDIQSHTYDMHQSAAYETGPARTSASMLPGETEEDFMAALTIDLAMSRAALEPVSGGPVNVLAYPLGVYSDLTQAVYAQQGIQVTLGTREGVNTVVRGLPQSLMGLKRFSVNDSVTPEQLLEMIAPAGS